MIKIFEEYNVNNNLLKTIMGDCQISTSLSNFFNNNCSGDEELFLFYLNKLCVGKIIKCSDFEILGKSAFIKKDFYNDKIRFYIVVVDTKNIEHVLPGKGKIEFFLPKKNKKFS